MALRRAVFPRGSRRDKVWASRIRPLLMRAFFRAPSPTLPPPEIRTWTSPAARLFGEHDTVKSILVIKLDHIGDFLLAIPAFAQLRRSFADAEITLLCATWNASLARQSGLFDHVVPFDFYPSQADARRRPPADPRLVAKLGLPTFDIAIDLRVNEDTREVLRHVSARCKAGFFSELMPDDMAIVLPGAPRDPPDNAGIPAHRRGMMLQLVAAVAACFDPGDDSRRLLDQVSAEHDAAVVHMKENWRTPVVAVSASSGREIKNWPIENFIAVIRWIIADLRGTVVLLGGATNQREAVLVSREVASPHLIDLVGQTPLEHSFAIVKHADLFLGNDSGLTHAASLLRIPTVALYSGIDSIAAWGPLGPNATAIRAAVPCSPCFFTHITDCPHDHVCMRAIPVETVKQAVLRHLASRGEKPASCGQAASGADRCRATAALDRLA